MAELLPLTLTLFIHNKVKARTYNIVGYLSHFDVRDIVEIMIKGAALDDIMKSRFARTSVGEVVKKRLESVSTVDKAMNDYLDSSNRETTSDLLLFKLEK